MDRGNGAEIPEEKKTLALQLRALCDRWQLEDELEEEEITWLFELIEDLLLDAFRGSCGEAGWPGRRR